jgi:hypothetical protein
MVSFPARRTVTTSAVKLPVSTAAKVVSGASQRVPVARGVSH